VLIVVPLWPAK